MSAVCHDSFIHGVMRSGFDVFLLPCYPQTAINPMFLAANLEIDYLGLSKAATLLKEKKWQYLKSKLLSYDFDFITRDHSACNS
jgi:hypothetical protein